MLFVKVLVYLRLFIIQYIRFDSINMSFRHTFCQHCDVTEATDEICQNCNDLCVECCIYSGDHPPYKCPSPQTCNFCAKSCEWCVYINHTIKNDPEKTYGGLLPDKCHHVGKTKAAQAKEELDQINKIIQGYRSKIDYLENEKKKLEVVIAGKQCADDTSRIMEAMLSAQENEKTRKKVTCSNCKREGHNKTTCLKRAKINEVEVDDGPFDSK